MGRNKSITLDGHRLYSESFSKSLIHAIAESRISMANSVDPVADKSTPSNSDPIEPSISKSKLKDF